MNSLFQVRNDTSKTNPAPEARAKLSPARQSRIGSSAGGAVKLSPARQRWDSVVQ